MLGSSLWCSRPLCSKSHAASSLPFETTFLKTTVFFCEHPFFLGGNSVPLYVVGKVNLATFKQHGPSGKLNEGKFTGVIVRGCVVWGRKTRKVCCLC